MSTTVWIVLAFVLGVLFGRVLGRSSRTVNAGGASSSFGGSNGPRTIATSASPVQRIQVGDPNGQYQITLLSRGPNPIRTIKAIREVTHLGLKESKDLHDAAPAPLIRVSAADHANAVARIFQGVAPLQIEGPTGYSQPLDPSFGQGFSSPR